ncbi:hypothetical protein HNE72_003118 [Salmonella enterica]|nr:hypothetical protein [Salmonella enterica]EEI2468188.1 hypothetical protein [Salmonella enterica]EFB0317637.1 hypothetical protein [Salmonella enterica]EFO7607544.1 hypothetical protein [Salmonella enterica]EGH6794403.1 hypothetical protein [Salmonella enterica]EGP8211431.1 hypothetical protein [Salmonella enterica]
MPLNIKSCLCTSSSSIDSFIDTSSTSKDSTQSKHPSGGYVTTNTKVKSSEIKPLASCLHPKLRMHAKEYTQYKQLMDSMEASNKHVRFDMDGSASHTNALDDTDTDFVPFEEFEQWRLKRLQAQVSISSSDSNAIPADKPLEGSALSVEQAISANYDTPRKQAIPANYDIPRKQTIPANYDIPRKQAIPANYDIPRKQAIPANYDTPRKQTIPANYDTPRKQAIPANYDIPRKQTIPANYDTPRKQAIPANYDIPRK